MVDWKQAPVPEANSPDAASATGAVDPEAAGATMASVTGSDASLEPPAGSLSPAGQDTVTIEGASTPGATDSFDPWAMINHALGIEVSPIVVGVVTLVLFFLLMIYALAPRSPSKKELDKYRPNPGNN